VTGHRERPPMAAAAVRIASVRFVGREKPVKVKCPGDDRLGYTHGSFSTTKERVHVIKIPGSCPCSPRTAIPDVRFSINEAASCLPRDECNDGKVQPGFTVECPVPLQSRPGWNRSTTTKLTRAGSRTHFLILPTNFWRDSRPTSHSGPAPCSWSESEGRKEVGWRMGMFFF
jgi:hypothetical protein